MGAEDTIVRLRQIVMETGISLGAAARGIGLHHNSLNRLWDDNWHCRTDTLMKIERWIEHSEGPCPLGQIPLSGRGWYIDRDIDGWFVIYNAEPCARGPYASLRKAVADAKEYENGLASQAGDTERR